MPHTWTAKWIWMREYYEVNAHLLFRKDFEVDGTFDAAKLVIAAESFATVYLNGKKVHFTTSLSYPGQHYYEEADLTAAVRPGRNQLAVMVRYIGIPSGASCPKDPGLACEIIINRPGREPLAIVSNKSWPVLRLKAWPEWHKRSDMRNLDLVEMMDYRLLPKGWPMVTDLTGFEEPEESRMPGVRRGRVEPRPFAKAVLSDYHGGQVIRMGTVTDRRGEFPIPAVAVTLEEITDAPLGITGFGDFVVQPVGEGQAATVLFKLEKYLTGYPTLEAEGNPGTIIDISYHEKLKDGRLAIHEALTADRYTLAAGPQEIQTDEWSGMRYLQLTFRRMTSPVKVRNLRIVEAAYPLKQKTFFRSSDPRFDRLIQICLNSVRHCMQDNIMDCPWREKRQWIGDAQRISLINHYAFGDRQLVRGVLRQHVQLQDPSGRMWVCQPLLEEYPNQSMDWLSAVVEYEQFTGDTTLLDEVADNAEWMHRWFMKQRDSRGLFFNTHTPIINWMDTHYHVIIPHQFRTQFLAVNLRYLQFLDEMAWCFKRLGRSAEARKTRAERAKIAALILPAFRDEKTGLLRDCSDPALPVTFSEMAHALAVRTEVCGGQEEALWDAFTAYRATTPENIIHSSPYGKYQTLEALGQLGRPGAIMDEILAGWGPMVDAGSDTAWEGFDGRGSWCHGWAGIPVVALMRHVFKMDPRKPRKRRMKNLGGMAWMECEVVA